MGSIGFPRPPYPHHVYTPGQICKKRTTVQPVVMTGASGAALGCLHGVFSFTDILVYFVCILSIVCAVCILSIVCIVASST